MELIQRRRELLTMQKPSNVLYEAYNLSFNEEDVHSIINTGVYLFTQENINRDFEFIAEDIAGASEANKTIICAKHNGNAYGFLVRVQNAGNNVSYNGTIYIWPSPGSIVVRRINGQISVTGTNITNPAIQFTNAVFDWPLMLGCAVQDNGSNYRSKTGTIGHVLVRWL